MQLLLTELSVTDPLKASDCHEMKKAVGVKRARKLTARRRAERKAKEERRQKRSRLKSSLVKKAKLKVTAKRKGNTASAKRRAAPRLPPQAPDAAPGPSSGCGPEPGGGPLAEQLRWERLVQLHRRSQFCSPQMCRPHRRLLPKNGLGLPSVAADGKCSRSTAGGSSTTLSRGRVMPIVACTLGSRWIELSGAELWGSRVRGYVPPRTPTSVARITSS